MNCRLFVPLIMAERDRLLTRLESVSLADHAGGCASCRPLLAEERRMRALLRSARMSQVEVPEDFGARVLGEIAQRQALTQAAPASRRAPATGRRLLFMAAGLLLAGLVGLRFASQLMNGGVSVAAPERATLAPASPASLKPRLLWSDGRAEIVESPRAEQAALQGAAASDLPVLTTASIVEWSF